MADGDGETDVVDISGNGKGVALNVYETSSLHLMDGDYGEVEVQGGLFTLDPNAPAILNKVRRVSNVLQLGAIAIASAVTMAVVLVEQTGRSGIFKWDSSDLSTEVALDTANGIYKAPNEDTTGASGAWVRDHHKDVSLDWFGGLADDTGSSGTDNRNAIVSMLPVIDHLNIVEVYSPGRRYVSAQVDLKQVVFFKGTGGSALSAEPLPSCFRFPQGSAGFTINDFYSLGYTTLGVPTTSAHGSSFERIRIQSGTDSQLNNTFGAGASYDANAEADGILLRTRAYISNCQVVGFRRNGVAVLAGSDGNPLHGNANMWCVQRSRITQNGSCGIYVEGTDANAGMTFFNDLSINRRWGLLDAGFLLNTHIGNHTESNGVGNGTTDIDSICSHAGKRWVVAFGRENDAATEEPGTGTAWIEVVDKTGGRPWANGFIVVSGGPFTFRNGHLWFGGYNEEGQGPAQIVDGSFVISGTQLAGVRGGTHVSSVGGLTVNNVIASEGSNGAFVLKDRTNSEKGWTFYHESGNLQIQHTDGAYIQLNSSASVAVFDSWTIRTLNLIAKGKIGYVDPAGTSVTQLTSKATAVTANKANGQITTFNTALAASEKTSFTLNSDKISADDNVHVWPKAGFATAGTYRTWSEGNANGSRTIWLENISGGSLSENVVIGFSVFGGTII
jgi:hypothetical protein